MVVRVGRTLLVPSASLRHFPPVLLYASKNRHYSNPSEKKSSESFSFPKYNEKTYADDVKKFSQLPINFGANQHISINDELKEKLRGVLWKFNAPIRYAFAYGSGVFQQAGADAKNVCSRWFLT
jgi:hypothetical protein